MFVVYEIYVTECTDAYSVYGICDSLEKANQLLDILTKKDKIHHQVNVYNIKKIKVNTLLTESDFLDIIEKK